MQLAILAGIAWPRTKMARILLASLLGAVVCSAWGAVSWMVLRLAGLAIAAFVPGREVWEKMR